MKIGAIVVAYNPSAEVLNNIKQILMLTNDILIVDNSDKQIDSFVKGVENLNIDYYYCGENKGIAFAQKKGMNFFIEKNFDWVLTMDQDSTLPKTDYSELLHILDNYKNKNVGFITLSQDTVKFNYKSDLEPCDVWISSGNFINVASYKKIRGFREELFIDWVDIDLCGQFRKAKIPMLVYTKITIHHTVGNPLRRRFLWKKFTCLNESPLRVYYRVRNAYYLFKIEKTKELRIPYLKEKFIQYIKIRFFEPNAKEKLKMRKLGIKHAKERRLGKYAGN